MTALGGGIHGLGTHHSWEHTPTGSAHELRASPSSYCSTAV